MRRWGVALVAIGAIALFVSPYLTVGYGTAMFVVMPGVLFLLAGVTLLVAAQPKAVTSDPRPGTASGTLPAPGSASPTQSHG